MKDEAAQMNASNSDDGNERTTKELCGNRNRRDFLVHAASGVVGVALAGRTVETLAEQNLNRHAPTRRGSSASALTNIHRLTPRPPLGWNSFDSYGLHIGEQEAFANLEVMARRLKPHGYEYFVIDGGWYNEYDLVPGTNNPTTKQAKDRRLDEYGRFVPSKTYFPNGMRPLITRTHELGLKFGIHIMRGIPRKAVELNTPIKGTPYRARDIANVNSICKWSDTDYGIDMTKPGAQAYYDSWIGMLAEWGVDFIKADDITAHPAEIEAVARAIEKTGRPIVYSLSPGGDSRKEHLPAYRTSNMLRTTKDIWDNRESFERAFAAWRLWDGAAGGGFWLDLDMIPFGHLMTKSGVKAANGQQSALHGQGVARMSLLTPDQHYTFITMRALAASPLFMGGALPSTDEFSFDLITNREMLACNQNGVVGRLVYERDGIEAWLTPRKNNRNAGWLGILHRTPQPKAVRLTNADLSLQPNKNYKLLDVWNALRARRDTRNMPFRIGADGVVFLKYEA